MYIPRLIDNELLIWKESKDHKPLLLRGARQVGKSRSVQNLAKTFDYYIEVNFEKNEELKTIFTTNIDVKAIVSKLSAYFSIPVLPGKTLIFLDEIQACVNAIKSLWFFREDFPELHVIAAGSLLEFTLKKISSFGVGRIRSLYMYPLSFDEFLAAQGETGLVTEKNEASSENPLDEIFHNRLVEEFRKFMIIGGMPASVSAWVNTHDYLACAQEQEDIQQAYYDDFAKYSESVEPQLLRATLQSVVEQVGRKFVYSRVPGGYRGEDVKKALCLLADAGIIKEVKHTAANGLPLGAEVNNKFKKYLYLDSGLLLRIIDLDMGEAGRVTKSILVATAEDLVNKGSLTEMVAGWEMLKYASPRVIHDLFYWEALDNGASSEVDYITVKDAEVLPIEVKSGTSVKMKSLRLFMSKKCITQAVRLSLENFGVLNFEDRGTKRKISIIPLYDVKHIFH